MAHEVKQSREDLAARVREALRLKIGSDRFDLWTSPETHWEIQSQTLTLGFATEFASQLCRKTLGSEIGQALREIQPNDKWEVRYEVMHGLVSPSTESCDQSVHREASRTAFPSASARNASAHSASAHSASARNASAHNASARMPAVSTSERPTPFSHSTARETSNASDWFQNFILGDSNQMACAAVKMAASEPGRLSPIVLHGPPGCGKSMLLTAIAQRLRGGLRMRRVVYMTSEQFTNDFTEGLRGGGLPMFRRKYRDVEALLLDDLQFFAGKKSTVAEVRHTIDNLIRNGKQVVVSLDRPLHEVPQLGEELLGRLRGGLVTPLFPLDSGIRLNLIQRLANEAGLTLEPGVLEQLSERILGDGRLIRGVVHRLMAVASLQPGRLTWDRSWSAVYDLVQASQPVIRLADIEKAVCGMFGLDQDSLQSQSKMRSISQPRMLAMFLARKYTPSAYKEIGEYFGRRRHSTVISAEKTVESWLKENAQLEGPRQLSVRDAIRHVTAQLQVG